MSSNRPSRRVALLGLLGLAGCGFAPIYGVSGVTLGAFTFQGEDSVMGFRLTGRLRDRFGPPNDPQFAIKATVDVSERAAAITSDGDTSRLNVIGEADWTLTDLATDRQVDSGTVTAFTSYSATGSTVATQTAQDDARARLATMLADQIVTRIAIIAPGRAT